MGHVEKTINGRTYRLSCGDGEEPRLAELLDFVDSHVRNIVSQFGQVGEDRLMLMAALTAADELWDARGELEAQTAAASEQLRSISKASRSTTKKPKLNAAKDVDVTGIETVDEPSRTPPSKTHSERLGEPEPKIDPDSVDARRSGGTYR